MSEKTFEGMELSDEMLEGVAGRADVEITAESLAKDFRSAGMTLTEDEVMDVVRTAFEAGKRTIAVVQPDDAKKPDLKEFL